MSLLQRLKALAHDSQDPSLFFLNDSGDLHEAISYKELYQQAAGLARALAAQAKVGDCVWLILDHGPLFLRAFYACQMARLTAVPLAPPDLKRGDHAFEAFRPLANTTQPRWILTDETTQAALTKCNFLPEHTVFFNPSHSEPLADPEIEADGDDRAVLLFTSGSTSQPKGVSLRTPHLTYNARNCCETWDIQTDAVLVSWMPNHHSFGMVFNALLPVWSGCRWVGMAPQTYLANPSLWLKAMSDFAGTHTAAATFGYQYAVDHVRAEQINDLSLKSWRVGLVSAEPVRRGVYLNFMQKFSHLDLNPNFFSPLYGLSESGPITGHSPLSSPRFLETPDTPPHLHHAAVGAAMPDTRIRIVDPQSHLSLPEGEVGEIWISGPSVLNRYFKNDQANCEAFRALPGEGGHFFRTGDQGFFKDGQLYLTGRLKELIIIAGKNYVPQDVEWAFLQGHHAFAGCKAAAFSEGEGIATKVTVAVEAPQGDAWQQGADVMAMLDEGMLSVWRHLGLRVNTAYLIPAQSLPRTASGKLRRAQTQAMLNYGQLKSLQMRRNVAVSHATIKVAHTPAFEKNAEPKDQDALADQIAGILAAQLEMDATEIDLEGSLSVFQLDSLQIMTFAQSIEDRLGIKVKPAWLFRCDNLLELSEILAEHSQN